MTHERRDRECLVPAFFLFFLKQDHMAMKQIILYSLLGLLSLATLRAQSIERSVIGATGGYAQTSSGSVSSTVGEIATTTVSSGSVILTQGFQQPVQGDFTSIRRPELTVRYQVYPNPTAEALHIELDSPEPIDLQLTLVDMQGRTVGGFDKSFNLVGSQRQSWDLSPLSEGTYVLRFVEDNGVVQAVRVRKQ